MNSVQYNMDMIQYFELLKIILTGGMILSKKQPERNIALELYQIMTKGDLPLVEYQ